jgi:hypothetical protein
MTERVRGDAAAFDVEIEDFLGGVSAELEGVSRRVGLVDRRDGGTTGGILTRTGATPSQKPEESPTVASSDENIVARCFGCLLSLICNQRLATV